MDEGRGRARVVLGLDVPVRKSELDETSAPSFMLVLLGSLRRKVDGERKDGGEMGS